MNEYVYVAYLSFAGIVFYKEAIIKEKRGHLVSIIVDKIYISPKSSHQIKVGDKAGFNIDELFERFSEAAHKVIRLVFEDE